MKNMRLENFRCYEDQSIDFRSGINLLVGDNASGKTTILKACRYVISSFFVGFSDENTTWNALRNEDFRLLVNDGVISPRKTIKIEFSKNTQFKYKGAFSSDFSNDFDVSYEVDMQYLSKSSSKSSKTSVLGIKAYKQECEDLQKTYYNSDVRVKPLPLYAYFAAKDYENTNAQIKKKFKQYEHIPSFGYYECLEVKSNFSNWIYRLMVLQEGQKNLQDIDIINSAIVAALGDEGCGIISAMDVRDKQGDVYFILSDGREIGSKDLSDGYKRIVNIVLDLAFRCTHLNRGLYGAESCKKTIGTVLIDEIDLHLHPTLQSTILKGLRNAFPKLQFIVTSHAPMIMSSVESNDENVVYKLDYSNEEGYTVKEEVTYGMDLSTISKVILGQPPRDPKSDADLKHLFNLIDEDNLTEAKVELERLKTIYTNNPELTRAETVLNFAIFDDEEDN